MHTRSFVAMPLWMTDGYIKKAVVRKSENSRRPNGALFKSILCLDFFPVSLFEESDRTQHYQHTIAQYQANDTHNQTRLSHVLLFDHTSTVCQCIWRS